MRNATPRRASFQWSSATACLKTAIPWKASGSASTWNPSTRTPAKTLNGSSDHVRSRIEAYAERNGLVLACGPAPFLKAVQGFALAAKARCQLSLESRMACGVGACLGCVTKTTEKWPVEEKAGTPVQTCTHGPVFWADRDHPGGFSHGSLHRTTFFRP